MHANLAVLAKLNLRDLDACRDVFADDFIWHYFNPKLRELEGDYPGIEGLKEFFGKLSQGRTGNFQVNVIDARPVGDELVVTQVCNQLDLEGNAIEFDAVVVWRILNGKIAEGWDVPAINTVRAVQNG